MKKVLACIITIVMLLSIGGYAAVAESTVLDMSLINLDSARPIVKDGVSVTLSIAGKVDAAAGDPSGIWWWKFLKDNLKLDVEFEPITGTAADERISLMFASDDIPDFLIGFALSTEKLTQYGTVEGQLMALENYITPELTPNIYKLLQSDPQVFAMATAPDGHMYTLPNMTYTDTAFSATAYFRQDWLSAVGMESPTTLDELLEVLRAFKVAGLAGADTVPLGGSFNSFDPSLVILYALGFDGVFKNYTVSPFIRDGKITIPAGDPVYKEYLSFMYTLYSEGLINQSFYTLDDTQVKAQFEEQAGAAFTPYGMPTPSTFKKFWAMQPLTSEFSQTPVWTRPAYFGIGNFVMSSKCQHPEVVMRFIDYLYSDEGNVYEQYGPPSNASEEDLHGYGGYYFDENRAFHFKDCDGDNHGGYANDWDYMCKRIEGWNGGLVTDRRGIELKRQAIAGVPQTGPEFNMDNVDRYMRKANLEVIAPFYTEGYPNVIWLDADTSTELNDIRTVLQAYVEEETAKFITGIRSLDEFDKYIQEVEALGMKEYLKIYEDAYAEYLAKLN